MVLVWVGQNNLVDRGNPCSPEVMNDITLTSTTINKESLLSLHKSRVPLTNIHKGYV